MAWINPVIGKSPTSPEILAAASRNSEGMVSVVESALAGDKKFLVGEEMTMADLFVIAALARGYQFVSYPIGCVRLKSVGNGRANA
jgi:elongation factor 1-gamma